MNLEWTVLQDCVWIIQRALKREIQMVKCDIQRIAMLQHSRWTRVSYLWTWTLGCLLSVSLPPPTMISMPEGFDSLHAGVPWDGKVVFVPVKNIEEKGLKPPQRKLSPCHLCQCCDGPGPRERSGLGSEPEVQLHPLLCECSVNNYSPECSSFCPSSRTPRRLRSLSAQKGLGIKRSFQSSQHYFNRIRVLSSRLSFITWEKFSKVVIVWCLEEV